MDVEYTWIMTGEKLTSILHANMFIDQLVHPVGGEGRYKGGGRGEALF